MVPSGRGLACGLQDQRLMARPPARAGGRSGLLTGGKSGKRNGFSPFFSQRVPSHVPSPPSRWAGRYGPFTVRAAGQVSSKRVQPPPTQPHQRRESRGKNLFPLGFFPHFFPRNGAPPQGSPPRPPPSGGGGKGEPPGESPPPRGGSPRGGEWGNSLQRGLLAVNLGGGPLSPPFPPRRGENENTRPRGQPPPGGAHPKRGGGTPSECSCR